ncbi:MAG: fumarylacetoacetate hydrolase family protein [Ardenticatenaceae bacterium]|nr:fumarylacetoacetate hydrolase family protein [Ardenticatenaceae bacterium]
MKLVTYQHNNQIRLGAWREDGIVDLTAVAPNMLTLIEMGADGLAQAQTHSHKATSSIPLANVKLLAPIPDPRRNIFCLGLNYAAHAEESNRTKGFESELPQFPVIFTKATTCANGPYDNIPFDAHVSDKIDWEVELAVVISKNGKNISTDEAMNYIYGYTIMNDVSARDLQRDHKQFFKGKSLDGYAPMGPCLVTADDLSNPHNLHITCRVNGVTKQESNTSQMIFDIPATLYHLSRGATLLAGDIIATGTPEGVGFARTPPEFLKPGDVVECEVEGIGVIRNQIG